MSRYTSTGPLHGKASDTDTMSATGSEGSGVLLSLSSRSITDSDCAPISTPSASTDHAIDDDGGGIAYSNDSESTHSISSASSPLLTANYTAFILDPADTLTAEFSNLTFAEQTRALAAVRRFNRDESEASRSRPETSYSGSQTSGTRAQTSNNESQASIAGLRSKAKPKQRSNNDGESDKPTLADWQALCKACGILSQDLPESISKCKQVLPSSHPRRHQCVPSVSPLN